MNTKETKNQNQSEETVVMNNSENTVMKNNEQTLQKTSAKNEKAAYAAGGFAAGLASGVAGSAIAANPAEDDVTEEIAAEENVVVTETAQEVVEEQAYTTLDQLKGKKIGVQKGTTGWLLIKDEIDSGSLKDTGTTVVEYDSGPVAFTALKTGKVDFVVLDKLPALSLVK